jgi:hypothetical protein
VFASVTAKVVAAACALIGAIALLGTFLLNVTGGLPYVEFALALVFFAMFISRVVPVDGVRAGARPLEVVRPPHATHD